MIKQIKMKNPLIWLGLTVYVVAFLLADQAWPESGLIAGIVCLTGLLLWLLKRKDVGGATLENAGKELKGYLIYFSVYFGLLCINALYSVIPSDFFGIAFLLIVPFVVNRKLGYKERFSAFSCKNAFRIMPVTLIVCGSIAIVLIPGYLVGIAADRDIGFSKYQNGHDRD